ncbi:Multi-sensor hybrid histidine kinase [Citrifermentans bremense]|uniref:histidine kinase n=1 Tax=Citrifermentans bremense TaxID=60035 RepID=A0A6S6LWR5_9BACT|nr:cache domain-containing protein [Citrifermentans bremense]BCG45768.1 Multi-sensor hybrid histidine kinase [Citrifermentans bremense]
MSRLASLSIRSLLLLITFVVALPAAVIILYSGIEFRNAMLGEAQKDTVKFAETIVNEQRNLVVAAEQLMTALAQLPEVKVRDRAKVESVLKELLKLNSMYANITIADRDGRVWASAVPALMPLNVSNRQFFKSALATGKLSSGEYIVSRITTKPIINLGYPVRDDRGAIAGVIGVAFNLENYRHLLQQMRLPKGSSFVIIDHRGIILARGLTQGDFAGKAYTADSFRAMAEGPDEGVRVRKGLAGDTRIIAYRKLYLPGEKTPYMYVTAGIPVEVATQKANRSLLFSALLLSSFLALACLAAVLIGKWCIADRFRLLEEASRRVAAGDLGIRVSGAVVGGELGSLAQTLDGMAEQLRARTDALAHSKMFMNTIIETEPECVKLLDAEGRLQMMNRAGLKMIEADSLAQVQGQCVYSLISPEYRDAFIRLTERVFEGVAGNLVFEVVGLKGRHLWLDSHAVPFRNDQGEIVSLLSITRDVTELRKSEEERRENLVLFESLMRHSPMAIRIFDGASGKCILLNKATADIAGGDIKTMQEQNFRELKSWQESGMLAAAEKVLSDGIVRVVEADIRTSFGKAVVMSYILSRLLIKDKQHLLVVGRDVTDEKRLTAEKKKMEAQMLHVQKLESLGVLAGGIAHDFNNILMSVMGNAELALLNLPPESPARINLQNIEISSQRAADLARQMLAYSGKGNFVIEETDVNRLIEEMNHMLEVSISKKVTMRFSLDSHLPLVSVDATQIRQVIMNLVINASEAIGDRSGVISISTGAMECDAAFLTRLWLNDTLKEGKYVYFEVADDGCGMEQATLTKIFDPFFTTKFTGRGLGMAAVLGIVRGHKGTIEVHSEPGKGSKFTVFLPALPPGTPRREQEAEVAQLTTGTGTVMLVDDEETIRNLGTEMLQILGYSVLTAEDGVVAVDLFQKHHNDIVCVILDQTMPNLDGEQTFRILHSIDPAVKVIMSSGFSEQDIAERFTGRGLAGFIQKPYRLANLSRMLQELG